MTFGEKSRYNKAMSALNSDTVGELQAHYEQRKNESKATMDAVQQEEARRVLEQQEERERRKRFKTNADVKIAAKL